MTLPLTRVTRGAVRAASYPIESTWTSPSGARGPSAGCMLPPVERLERRRLLSAAASSLPSAAAVGDPAVLAREFVFAASPSQVRYTFSENVQPSLAAQDLEVTNLNTGETFAPSSVSYNGSTNVATFTLPASLANGAYLASLPARSVTDNTGNPLESEASLQFFVLTGDGNRDRAVNGSDFALLAGNFGKSGQTYAGGDLNADALVDGTDFALLAGNFGRSVPAVTMLYDSAGFEPPRFTPAQNLAGQDPTGGPWLSVVGVSSATVQTATVSRGQHSVRVSRVANANGDSEWIALPDTSPSSGVVNVDADMNVTQSTGLVFGPVFGLEAYDGANLIGSVTVDAATGDVLYQQAGTGSLTETGTVVSRGAYHRYRLSVNLTERTYSVFLDGALLRTEGFVDVGAAAFTDAPLATLAATEDTVATATGTAFFDNYRVSHVAAPAAAGAAVSGATSAGAIRLSGPPAGTARPRYAPQRVRANSELPLVAGKARPETPARSAPQPASPAAGRPRGVTWLPRRRLAPLIPSIINSVPRER